MSDGGQLILQKTRLHPPPPNNGFALFACRPPSLASLLQSVAAISPDLLLLPLLLLLLNLGSKPSPSWQALALVLCVLSLVPGQGAESRGWVEAHHPSARSPLFPSSSLVPLSLSVTLSCIAARSSQLARPDALQRCRRGPTTLVHAPQFWSSLKHIHSAGAPSRPLCRQPCSHTHAPRHKHICVSFVFFFASLHSLKPPSFFSG